VRELFVDARATQTQRQLLRRAAAAEITVHLVDERVLATLTDAVTPQGVVALVQEETATWAAVLDRGPRLLAALVDVADPGNAGTVIRTADAAGADAVVLTTGSVDPYNPKAVRASAGSVCHLPVVTGVAEQELVGPARAAGLTVLAADAGGEDDLDRLDGAGALAAPALWVFGSEAHGLPAAVRAGADRRVRIPIHGRAESLNLAASAAICLYASARAQRR
jgi:TrmH family RNA methyltransferase